MGGPAPSLHRESTDSLISMQFRLLLQLCFVRLTLGPVVVRNSKFQNSHIQHNIYANFIVVPLVSVQIPDWESDLIMDNIHVFACILFMGLMQSYPKCCAKCGYSETSTFK